MATSFVVCPDCRGTGYGDRLGDVTEMVHEDAEFAEDYRAGFYNTGCERCRGRNVVPMCGASGCSEPIQEGECHYPAQDEETTATAEQYEEGWGPYRFCFEHLTADQQADLFSDWEIDAMYAAEQRMGA